MPTISELLQKYDTDKNKGHHYAEAYEDICSSFERQSALNILEIGIQKGESLLLWHEFFPNAKVTGIDIKDAVSIKHPDIHYVFSDVKEYRTDEMFDIVIDDGSHFLLDVLFSLSYFVKKLKKGGILVIEDVQNPPLWSEIFQNIVPHNCELLAVDMRKENDQYDDFLLVVQRMS